MTLPEQQQPDAVETMRAFRLLLPDWARHELLGDPGVHAWLMRAVGNGWALPALAEHVAYHVRGLDNAGQVMRHRLHKAAHPDQDEGAGLL
jgi:hypothetical protein